MTLQRRVRLGPVDVALSVDEPAVLTYLAEFYAITDDTAADAAWTVDARLGTGRGMRRNPWGVRYLADAHARVLSVRAHTVSDLAMTTRNVLREALVDHYEQQRYVMLHASAFADDSQIVLLVGESGAGKTTLALKAAIYHGCRYLCNDHLILYAALGPGPDSERLVITTLPGRIPLKIGTYLDLESRLPAPWDDEGVDIDAFRALPPQERYRHDRQLLFTSARLARPHPPRVELGGVGDGPEVVVVLARYAAQGESVRAPNVVADADAALWPHVRFDWVSDPMRNTRHLPVPRRNRDAFAADARRLVTALTDRAEVVSWAHGGDPLSLLDCLGVGS